MKYFWEKDIAESYANQQRFNLLLLEPGEIYFEDYSVFYYPLHLKEDEAIKRRQKGRLKICSKSILFEPLDNIAPILKLLYRNIKDIGKLKGALLSKLEQVGDVINVEASVCISMHEGTIIGPYKYIKEQKSYGFSLNYVNVSAVIQQIQQLIRAQTLSPHESSAMVSTIIASKQSHNSFNTTWIEDLYEKIVVELPASKIGPLVCNPGHILLTSARFYFQPFNNVEKGPVLKIKLSSIGNVTKRRYLLSHVGIEVFERDKEKSWIYLIFENKLLRDDFYDKLLQQEDLKLDCNNQENMTLKWQSGALSNFEYLLYLNSQADRSFNDLTQYPVFPWIIKDYTSKELDLSSPSVFRDLSKPMGAMDDDRLFKLKERCSTMPEPKFLYGSHYSSPAFVLFYLVRVAPEYMLCLQNGKFDNPDRLFNSIRSTWTNCCTGHSDFKELIPEFYNSDGSFLLNNNHLQLGMRQDGSVVNHVDLPPWANSAHDFIEKLRNALECDYVSQHLNNWIDLIFGYQQQGDEAWKAHNVFYYLTYEGAVNLESLDNIGEKSCYEAQILEFGQTPKQLFTKPHPRKQASISIPPSPIQKFPNNVTFNENMCEELFTSKNGKFDDIPVLDLNKSFGRQVSVDIDSGPFHWTSSLRKNLSTKLHKDVIQGIKISKDGSKFYSVSQDCQLKIYSIESEDQIRSINLCNMALSCCCITEDEKSLLIGSWDNNIYVYSIDYSRVTETIQQHRDAVSSMVLKKDTLITSSWDTALFLWEIDTSGKKPCFNCIGDLDHDAEITACDFCKCLHTESNYIVCGTKHGQVVLWNGDMMSHISDFTIHTDEITEVLFSEDGDRILTCSLDGQICVIDIESEVIVYKKTMKCPVCCAQWDGNNVVCGMKNGTLLVWNLVKDIAVATITIFQEPITALCINNTTKTVVVGSSNGFVAVLSL